MKIPSAFLDTSVLLTEFGRVRNGGSKSFMFDTDRVQRTTFEKCIFESFLAFRGVGGKKPDEGRQDWAQRFLRLPGDPFPLGDAAGKLHSGSINAAHYWTGQADEAQSSSTESFDEFMEKVKKIVRPEDWNQAAEGWENLQKVLDNHQRYQKLFFEFRVFLSDHNVLVIDHEDIYTQERREWRFMTMEGLSQRSTIPNEDFEIVVAALLSGSDLFVSTDNRLLAATASIEVNLKSCDFIHLSAAEAYIQSLELRAG